MLAEIITIGDEILIGQIVDTNSAWIAQQLNQIGVKVKQISSVSDNKEHILKALSEAEERASLILITGGLGPTKDDITKHTLCEYFNTQLVFNQEVYNNLEKIFSLRGKTVSETNRHQAEVPSNCIAIENKLGTAAGMWFEKNGKVFISMPGVPYEMKGMMENVLLDKIKSHFTTPTIIHRTILTQGIGESYLADMITEWEEALPNNMKLAYLPSLSMVRLRISASGESKVVLEEEVNKQAASLQSIIQEHIFGFETDTLEGVIGKLLLEKKQSLATAESCTGGYIAHLITKVAGCSEYYKGSVIAYSNEIKTSELNVSTADLQQYGAVSREVVEQMAKGVKEKFNTDYAIATSGIAGPTGGSIEKPIGTVWIAIATPKGIVSEKYLFGDNRLGTIQRAALTALHLLQKEIKKT
jgi:nicotinamide-nucleotide amidase